MHQLTLTGHIGKDAIVRDAHGAKAISFSVAVNETHSKNNEKVETTTWYDCTIWRGSDEKTTIADYLKEGQQVLIQGKPKPGGYKNAQGDWVPTIEVRVTSYELLGRKPASQSTEASAEYEAAGGFIADDRKK
ncbi:single-stranded DNA-binding protein [Hymenobacter sp. J193]|uniref:single-stranded DNA-binding protein n=1 Tax=Hymenobacter sp. J193 TaxID=2898429 RepID=UPI002151A7BA|nr:single-stranded DNA-binding protein [Hymenobacter sp. J193]MCR5890378.1 single-stranded DNA-binding protein [Hymenobacter sp. J193]